MAHYVVSWLGHAVGASSEGFQQLLPRCTGLSPQSSNLGPLLLSERNNWPIFTIFPCIRICLESCHFEVAQNSVNSLVRLKARYLDHGVLSSSQMFSQVA